MLGPGQGNYTHLHGELGTLRHLRGGAGPNIYIKAPALTRHSSSWAGCQGHQQPAFPLSRRGYFYSGRKMKTKNKTKKPVLPQASSFPVHVRQTLA